MYKSINVPIDCQYLILLFYTLLILNFIINY